MSSYLIKNASIVNEGKIIEGDVLVSSGKIEKIGSVISNVKADSEIDATGKFLLPGAIDDQVHFREPGLTHKAEIYTESKAAVAGGVTSFMEMPNTKPPALTQDLLEQKYQRAKQVSLANYSFFMGTSNDNYDEIMKTDLSKVCGLKIFMGSSTGNMLVDDENTLSKLFRDFPGLIATHCEDEATIKQNMADYKERFGENVPIKYHPLIRSAEACYKSSSHAAELAKKHQTRLHILHISTEKEISLFDNKIPLKDKKITAEACIHHLWFCDKDYEEKGVLIKWNPAVKTRQDRDAVFAGVLDNHIDVIATDHAPHTLKEKQNTYFKAPSGGPLVQHSIVAMMEFYHNGKTSLEKKEKKMSHSPAILFRIRERGFIREGYHADLVLIDPNLPWMVSKENILYKCGWSPFEGQTFQSKVTHTFVNGNLVYENGRFDEIVKGKRLEFEQV